MERELYYSKDGTKVMIVSPIAELEPMLEHMDRLEYKHKYMLIIGNGFDLSLGLPTTYRNFVESCIFKKMYVKHIQEKKKNKISKPTLLDYLYGKKFTERWYDIEAALLEYVSKRPDGSFVNNVEEDKEEYELLCKTLIEYLSSLFKTDNDLKQANMMRNTIAGKFLANFTPCDNLIYSFNYTPIHLIINAIIANESLNPIRVHGEIMEKTIYDGNLHDNSIILGIETDDISNVAPGYSFLLKSNNPSFRSSNIAFDLLNSKNVIFFGHSLNQMDFGYFEAFFKMLESTVDIDRQLTIITKDEPSRVAIFDNLRKMGISVRDIYAHIKVETIRTDNLMDEESEDFCKYKTLMREINPYYE